MDFPQRPGVTRTATPPAEHRLHKLANDGKDTVSISCPMCSEFDVASSVVASRQLQEFGPEERSPRRKLALVQ
jgi:hypothetical protein